MQLKKMIILFRKYLPVFVLGFFSFFINYHYGFIGVMPMDNFVLYNGGYRVLSGYIPFTDYWLVTGPLLDYLNALIFYINGVSWRSFIIHSSLFNLIISVASYTLFIDLGLSKKFSLIYSIFYSLLFYPVVGTPFVDHHSTIFLILAFYFFIFAINNNKNRYLTAVPFLFCLSFLSKQTPAAYGLLVIFPLIMTYLLLSKEKRIQILGYLFLGSTVSVLFLLLFFYFTKINVNNFYEQYILFAKTLGDFRFSNYEFNLINILVKYKFISILTIFLTIILIQILKKKNIIKILIILSILSLSYLLVFHQYYTLNQNYIFFLIPFLTGVIHAFYKEVFIKKYFLFFIILICVYSTAKYHLRFNEHRKFNELEKVNLSIAIDAEVLSQDLKGLKWITHNYPKSPEIEIANLLKVIEILKNDNSRKTLITSYQFLASTLNIYDFSPNQWHHPSVSFPTKNQKYFKEYKYFFIQNLKKNSIDFIYETSKNEDTIVELIINKNCFKKEKVSEILIKLEIKKDCKDFQ
jgi:hypothetical protein